MKIVGMLFLFYCWNALHWWANFSLGICASTSSTVYNLIAFGSAICVITGMIIFGTSVNKLKLTHEFYQEKISEEKQRKAEIQAKEAAKHAAEAKRLWDCMRTTNEDYDRWSFKSCPQYSKIFIYWIFSAMIYNSWIYL